MNRCGCLDFPPEGKNEPQKLTLPTTDNLKTFLTQVLRETEELRSATALPDVDKDGGSECPFAEKLYHRKEKAEFALSCSVKQLNDYIRLAEDRILQAQSNLSRIQADQSRLRGSGAIDCYQDAQNAQDREVHYYIAIRDQMLQVLSKAEIVLGLSRTKKYPGIPRDDFGNPPDHIVKNSPESSKPLDPHKEDMRRLGNLIRQLGAIDPDPE
jgi:hypothetical protein